jgi:hypothetical protein
MDEIAANLIFEDRELFSVQCIQPTNYQDRKQGIDRIIKVLDTTMSYRVRNHEAERYWQVGFTIRTSAKWGKSELQKVKEGIHARYLLYALAHEENYGEIKKARLIDLYSVANQLNQNESLILKATHGRDFVEFDYDLFPSPVVVGTWGCFDPRLSTYKMLNKDYVQ